MDLDWLIIGGGIHGVHVAARLLGEAGVAPERLGLVDPGERLLARWRASTAMTGMTHLRSPSVHNIGLDAGALRRFAGKGRSRGAGLFAGPYDRPALTLFNDHCDHVVDTFGLDGLHLRDRAIACSVDTGAVGVQLAGGREVGAQNLVLAIGASEQPEWPDWAPRGDRRVRHVFAPGAHAWPSRSQAVAVVGGGISGAQVALRLLAEGHQVHLVSRHALRVHQFDSDPGWLGPMYMAGFGRIRDLRQRRLRIAAARHKGSVPPDVQRALRRAIAGELRWHEGEVEGLEPRSEGLELRLSTGAALEVQGVLLATGFSGQRPGGAMIDALIATASLPCAACGYPVVDSALRWHPRVYVTGPLAELELGPAARNIAGARRAGDRLVDAVCARRSPHQTKRVFACST